MNFSNYKQQKNIIKQEEKHIQNFVEHCSTYLEDVVFDNETFEDEINWKLILNDKDKIVKFDKCVFEKNVRFDDIKCKKLIFKDCTFKDGGGIKNREGENSLDIELLDLGFYELDGDFIVDIGMYARDDGTLQTTIGRIKELKFNNPQKGNGRVFFVGLNEKLEKGVFVNRVLDNVVFQNCDLRNCYFLNAKVDKTEFRNVTFNSFEDTYYMFVREDGKDGVITAFFLFIFIILGNILFYKYNFPDKENLLDVFFVFLMSFIFIMSFIIILMPLDSVYIFFLSCGRKLTFLLDKVFTFFNSKRTIKELYLNTHLGTKDEEKIIKILKKQNGKQNVINLRSLKTLYENLAINFMKTDKQIAGEFVYSSKFYKSLVDYGLWDFLEVFPNKYHHFINGFGQRWFRAFFHILFIIFLFSFIFVYCVKPNIDYISTKNTPSFLLEGVQTTENNANIIFNFDSFKIITWKNNMTKNIKASSFNNSNILYGYDGINNFNALKEQKVFALKENFLVGFYKSLSNLFYPFNSFSKNWFQNLSEKAYILSFFETILLWIFMIGFLKALWNRIKF
ncbi:hypothetical protein C3L23_04775 [Nautilia sp. PV-1]|uniref:pentapeptide repeat-containing protein n=1 Tax=Nautilia sp. PV-1 TaxID=2579250 RepID=UPI000FD98BF5|nr:pentapeptide repeat-containing protein [Nautilia sp. PV-1]AZV46611.1 hypothetical protein C3L23_04775 [Nautilia sp. PV-1]